MIKHGAYVSTLRHFCCVEVDPQTGYWLKGGITLKRWWDVYLGMGDRGRLVRSLLQTYFNTWQSSAATRQSIMTDVAEMLLLNVATLNHLVDSEGKEGLLCIRWDLVEFDRIVDVARYLGFIYTGFME